MAEVIRESKRETILSADSISLALDDKAPFRIVRYRACSKTKGTVSDGILAVLRHGGDVSNLQPSDLDEDYSLRIAESVLAAVRKLATPGRGLYMDDVAQAFAKHVRSYASDGGKPMVKCGLLLRQHFPAMSLRILDRAHCIRRAALPLTIEEKFFQFWHHVFDKRHAVIPDLQNSAEWRLRFSLIQKDW